MISVADIFDGAVNLALALLCLSFLVTIYRIIKGPTLPDRILGLDMLVAIAIGFIAVTGIKTGYTRASGFNLMTSAKSEGRQIVSIVLGGRSGAYEKALREARDIALSEMQDEAQKLGANAVIGIDLDYENISTGSSGSMLMVSASGTAVVVR